MAARAANNSSQSKDETMQVKKIGRKAFHLGNRLGGNGNDLRAQYGVFNSAGELIGHCQFSGVWDAYGLNGSRLNAFACSSLTSLKNHLATRTV